MAIHIQQIQPHQTAEAKRVILTVARNIYQWKAPLDEIIRRFDEHGELRDVDEVQAHYLERRGSFLVAMEGERVIGTGAIRHVDDETAELKRLWLLEAYQGRGIGFQLVQRLLRFAHGAGYKRIRLQTDIRSERAIRFYQRLGFQPIPCQSDDPEDVCMEVAVEDAKIPTPG